KLLIYLALGKPAVVTHLKAINTHRYDKDVVYFVEEKGDFVNTVQRAYHENSEELMKKRIAFAENHTWEHRMNAFLAIYRDSLTRKNNTARVGPQFSL
ncbi:MAG TPA: hypothetical protein VHO90_05615, partial [Bacteroidales bacterium]|nr:hypothetical protein [Bacteroidales bacterium]